MDISALGSEIRITALLKATEQKKSKPDADRAWCFCTGEFVTLGQTFKFDISEADYTTMEKGGVYVLDCDLVPKTYKNDRGYSEVVQTLALVKATKLGKDGKPADKSA